MSQTNHIVVVGGGIAGLALGIALGKLGKSVSLVEKQTDWQPLSSGIFINSNGLGCLDRLGVIDEILAAGWPSYEDRMVYLDRFGATITKTIYPRLAGEHLPAIVGIKRGELHRILVSGAASAGVEFILGTTVSEVHDDATGPVRATLETGAEILCDAVIGSDGIRSIVREFVREGVEPKFTGFGTWRSIHPRGDLATKTMMMGWGKRLGLMPISAEHLYVYATSNEPDNPWYPRENWHDLMREKFAQFNDPATELLNELVTPDQVVYTAVEEISLPLPWHKGRICLIGDAAHASSPYMSQGGAMALEDAVVLSEMIARSDDVETTLSQFGERRFPRCRMVQEASLQTGKEGGMEDLEMCQARDKALARNAQADLDTFYGKLAEPI